VSFPEGSEAGIRSPFSNLVGIDVAKFRGTNRQSDPGALSDDQFWLLQNCRIDGTGVKNRPGLSAIFTNDMSSCVYGIWDDRNPPDDGNTVFSASREGYSPQLWTANADASGATCFPGLAATFNGQRVVVSDNKNGYSFSYTTTAGVPTFDAAVIFTFASALTGTVRSFVEWDSALWFVYSDALFPSTVEIWKWTGGTTASLDKTFTVTDRFGTLGVSDSDLYITLSGDFPALPQTIRKRDDGAWTSLDMTAVFAAYSNWRGCGFTGYSRPPYLYFSGNGGPTQPNNLIVILKVLGTTVTVASDTIGSWAADTVTTEIIELGGLLYFVGPTTPGAGIDSLSLYQLSGANAATAVANLTAQTEVVIGSQDGAVMVQILPFRNQIYIDAGSLIVADIADPTTWALAASSAWVRTFYVSAGSNTFTG